MIVSLGRATDCNIAPKSSSQQNKLIAKQRSWAKGSLFLHHIPMGHRDGAMRYSAMSFVHVLGHSFLSALIAVVEVLKVQPALAMSKDEPVDGPVSQNHWMIMC